MIKIIGPEDNISVIFTVEDGTPPPPEFPDWVDVPYEAYRDNGFIHTVSDKDHLIWPVDEFIEFHEAALVMARQMAGID